MMSINIKEINILNLYVLVNILCIEKILSQTQPVQTKSALNQMLLTNSNCTFPTGQGTSGMMLVGNCKNQAYYLNLGLGSSDQILSFTIDSGVSAMWIPLVYGNQTGGFNFTDSTTVNITNSTEEIQYPPSSYVTGNLGSDFVSVQNSPINAKVDMLFVMNQSGSGIPPWVDGSIGLANSISPNFLDQAFSINQIKNSIFSLDFNNENQTSYLYFNNGLPSLQASKTLWVQNFETAFWQAQVISMSINGNQMTTNVPQIALLNTGSTYINIGTQLFNKITAEYFSGTYCIQDNGFNVCPCNLSTSWPSFSIMLLGAEINITPEMYRVKYSSVGLCAAGIVSIGGYTNIVLGLPFFRGYTVSFDKVNQKIGFYGATAQVYVYTGKTGYFLLTQYIMGGMMFGLALFGIIVIIVQKLKKSKLTEKQNEHINDQLKKQIQQKKVKKQIKTKEQIQTQGKNRFFKSRLKQKQNKQQIKQKEVLRKKENEQKKRKQRQQTQVRVQQQKQIRNKSKMQRKQKQGQNGKQKRPKSIIQMSYDIKKEQMKDETFSFTLE